MSSLTPTLLPLSLSVCVLFADAQTCCQCLFFRTRILSLLRVLAWVWVFASMYVCFVVLAGRLL